jgi:hypothetical protein
LCPVGSGYECKAQLGGLGIFYGISILYGITLVHIYRKYYGEKQSIGRGFVIGMLTIFPLIIFLVPIFLLSDIPNLFLYDRSYIVDPNYIEVPGDHSIYTGSVFSQYLHALVQSFSHPLLFLSFFSHIPIVLVTGLFAVLEVQMKIRQNRVA